MRFALLIVCLFVVSTGCIGGSSPIPVADGSPEKVTETVQTPQHPTTPSSSRYNIDVDQIEDLIHEKINDRREKNGVEPLARNETLDAVARYKSWDMAHRDYFGHTGPNGTQQIVVRDRYGTRCDYTGQNLNYHEFNADKPYPYPQKSLSDEDKLASDTVYGLFNSTGHRQNALDPNYDSQGIGVFVDENGTVFVTQELCG